MTDLLLHSGYEFDEGAIIFNQFKSAVSYKTEEKPPLSLNIITTAESMSIEDGIVADMLQNYQKSNLYIYLKESATNERTARMTAMDNASKNASDMINKLMLMFNFPRLAIITKELIEITSAAASQD
ncbi:ATP synthase subunit gamma, mitochondrial [Cricetulus griseus]|uniref:ATP synthase subunit gamma, mitochondrial n=1 Tax=Cricetulus griseus TaxID=10029 RepID=G3HRB4_CRIGR|nr:ATP synthase subunit gamma, mitochondrial [Cricetulus griseus]